MNTFETTTAVKALLISLVALAGFGAAAAMADQVGNSISSKQVSLTDLDLSTVQGQQIARERVRHMAHTLCAQVADPTDLSHHANYLACLDTTLAKAENSLQALVANQSTARFASADVK
jgi:UrcA family protein